MIVAIIGVVGWYVWSSKNKTTSSYNNASSATSVTKPVSNTLPIKEWGIKLGVGSVTDATYKLVGDNKAFLMSKSMSSDSKCTKYYSADFPSFTFLVRAKPMDAPVFGDEPGPGAPKTVQEAAAKGTNFGFYVKLGDYYYYSVHGNGMSCGNASENKLDAVVIDKQPSVQLVK